MQPLSTILEFMARSIFYSVKLGTFFQILTPTLPEGQTGAGHFVFMMQCTQMRLFGLNPRLIKCQSAEAAC